MRPEPWRGACDAGRPTHTLYVPVTWAFNDTLAVNANLGADWNFAGARTRRIGASVEWATHEKLTLIADRRTREVRGRVDLTARHPFHLEQ